MTYADFYFVLRESEQQAANPSLSPSVRENAAKLILSVQLYMAEMGLTREKLAELAKGNGSFVLTPRNRQYTNSPKKMSAVTP
jgi:hypothetical protein